MPSFSKRQTLCPMLKMKKTLTILFLTIAIFAKGQNLVPNSSFEDTTMCPDWISQIDRATGWSQFRPTADYFNTCSNSIYAVPSSFGYQWPSTGNAYSGLWCYNSTVTNLREYIGRQLSSPLIIGQKYYINVKYNLSNGSNCAVNKQGILFSTVEYNNLNWCPITNYAHVYSLSIINDTNKWTSISGAFIADSSYNYIIIGDFFSDNNVDTLMFDNSNCISYYYIDDVCVSTDSLTCNSNTNINETNLKSYLNIFPNPTNQNATLEFYNSKNENFTLTLYDTNGQLVRSIPNIRTNKVEIKKQNLTPGLYFFLLRTDRQIYSTGKLAIE